MKTDQQPEAATPVFLQTVSAALTQLKQRLQQDYEQVYPGLGEIIHLVLDEEETKAWELSSFRICFSPTWSRRMSPSSVSNLRKQNAPTSWCRIASSRCQPINQLSLMRIVEQYRTTSRGPAALRRDSISNERVRITSRVALENLTDA